jgi:hypothetical protein
VCLATNTYLDQARPSGSRRPWNALSASGRCGAAEERETSSQQLLPIRKSAPNAAAGRKYLFTKTYSGHCQASPSTKNRLCSNKFASSICSCLYRPRRLNCSRDGSVQPQKISTQVHERSQEMPGERYIQFIPQLSYFLTKKSSSDQISAS